MLDHSFLARHGDHINPTTIYIVFRASRKRQIKAQFAANGYSIGKSCNAGLALS